MHSCIYPILVLVIYIMYDLNKIIFLSIYISIIYWVLQRSMSHITCPLWSHFVWRVKNHMGCIIINKYNMFLYIDRNSIKTNLNAEIHDCYVVYPSFGSWLDIDIIYYCTAVRSLHFSFYVLNTIPGESKKILTDLDICKIALRATVGISAS